MANTEIKEIIELRNALVQMKQCVAGLRARYGDIPAVKRLMNDIERIDIEATEITELDTTPRQRERPRVEHEVVVIPEAPYDESLWRDADDEGLGGYRS